MANREGEASTPSPWQMDSPLDLAACRQQNYVAPPHMLELENRATMKSDCVAEGPSLFTVICSKSDSPLNLSLTSQRPACRSSKTLPRNSRISRPRSQATRRTKKSTRRRKPRASVVSDNLTSARFNSWASDSGAPVPIISQILMFQWLT